MFSCPIIGDGLRLLHATACPKLIRVKLLICILRHCKQAVFGRNFLLAKVEILWMVMSNCKWMLYESDPLMLMCFFILVYLTFLCSVELSSHHIHIEQNPKYSPSLSSPIQNPILSAFLQHPKNALNILVGCTYSAMLFIPFPLHSSFIYPNFYYHYHSYVPYLQFSTNAIGERIVIKNFLPRLLRRDKCDSFS